MATAQTSLLDASWPAQTRQLAAFAAPAPFAADTEDVSDVNDEDDRNDVDDARTEGVSDDGSEGAPLAGMLDPLLGAQLTPASSDQPPTPPLPATTTTAITQTTQAAPAPPINFAECEQFIREHERAVLNYLWRMLGEEETAYDLTQEVFLRAWSHFETIRHYEQPRSWLFRVATNLALTHLRRRARQGGRAATLDPTDSGTHPAESDHTWRLAERDLVRQTLLLLPPRRRAVLILREVQGLSAAEAGRALGMTETAVRMALHRAREQFRELYLRESPRGLPGAHRQDQRQDQRPQQPSNDQPEREGDAAHDA
ncbi:MAG: RNA polymerase sigma factor [Ktedonobacterales bacterium]